MMMMMKVEATWLLEKNKQRHNLLWLSLFFPGRYVHVRFQQFLHRGSNEILLAITVDIDKFAKDVLDSK